MSWDEGSYSFFVYSKIRCIALFVLQTLKGFFGFQITAEIATKTKLRITLDRFKIAKEIALPLWMGEVLKTSQRACTVRAYLGEKPHEAPRSEYCNSTHNPTAPPWMEC